jgi:outer membrane receptor protein involved in Fe transport
VHVRDPLGAAVAAATVRGSTRDGRITVAAVSDAAGLARLDVPCACVIQIEADGFAPFVAVVPHGGGLTATLSVASVHEHVTVTGTGALEPSSESSKAIDVVDRREIEARAEFAVGDVVQTVPGLTVQQLGGPGAFTSIKIRGLREQDTAVLIDGVRFRDPSAPQGDATGFIGELYLVDLERVEVLRGSGSSVHGSHAVAGAINLITSRGGGPLTGQVGIDAGQLGFTRLTSHVGGSTPRDVFSYSAGAGHTRTSRGVDGDDYARNTSVRGRGELKLSSSARATVRAYAADAATALNETPSAIGPLPSRGTVVAVPFSTFVPSANDPDARRQSRFASVLASIDHRPSARFGYRLAVHDLTTTRVYLDGPLGVTSFEPSAPTISDLRGRVTTVDVATDVNWTARHTTSARYERERETYESDATPVNRLAAWRADLRQVSHSVALQHQWSAGAWRVVGGLRGQVFSLGRTRFDPPERAPFSAASFVAPPAAATGDVSVSRSFDSNTRLHAHLGNAFRAPAMFERAGVSFGTHGYTIYGDPQLASERSVSFDAGVEQSLAGSRVRASATGFYSRLRHVIAFGAIDASRDVYGRTSGYQGADGRAARGVELTLRMEPTRNTSLKTSYTLANADAPAGGLDGLPRAAAVPAHQFAMVLMQQVRQLQLALQIDAASNHYLVLFDPVSFGSRAYEFGATMRTDGVATYTAALGTTRLRLFAAVDNLLDREYFVQGFRTARRTARVGAGVTF